jgi:hypothetical protein
MEEEKIKSYSHVSCEWGEVCINCGTRDLGNPGACPGQLEKEIEALKEKLRALSESELPYVIYTEHDVDDRECVEIISTAAQRLSVGRQIVPCEVRPSRFKIQAYCATYEEAKEIMALVRFQD